MSDAQDPIPTRQQIEAISDIEALEDLQEALDRRVTRIEVDLDFRPGDEEWASRARGALTVNQIALGQVGRHLHRLRKGSKGPPVSDPSAKLEKRRIAAERVLADAQERRARADLAAQQARLRVAEMLERTSFLAQFHKVACKLLPPDVLADINGRASGKTLRALEVETRAPINAPALSPIQPNP